MIKHNVSMLNKNFIGLLVYEEELQIVLKLRFELTINI